VKYSFRQKLGAAIYDLPRLVWSVRPSSRHPWLYVRNREEHLTVDESTSGVRCDWRWTSDLHVAMVYPTLGRTLMKRALRDWPIKFEAEPFSPNGSVRVSFIIGHRGLERLPHLILTLQSIAAQRDVVLECIVVEQSCKPEIREHLPSWVRYVHTCLPHADMPYSRAWAFNVGARRARGELLLLHDNDMLVTENYAFELFLRFGEGYEVINLKRFIFYLTEAHSTELLHGRAKILDESPESVVQNLEAGGSVGVSREAYFAIGGFDESFVGWGGEDNEFWERAQTRSVWPYSYLPIIHLWHSPQPGKLNEARATARLFQARTAVPADIRIRELVQRGFGNSLSPPQVGTRTGVGGQAGSQA
jgi:hypothetical protein